jgi:hypothetical protein
VSAPHESQGTATLDGGESAERCPHDVTSARLQLDRVEHWVEALSVCDLCGEVVESFGTEPYRLPAHVLRRLA